MLHIAIIDDLPSPEQLINWCLENNFKLVRSISGNKCGCILSAIVKMTGNIPSEHIGVLVNQSPLNYENTKRMVMGFDLFDLCPEYKDDPYYQYGRRVSALARLHPHYKTQFMQMG